MITQSDWGSHWTHGEIYRLCLNRLDLCNDLKLGLLTLLNPASGVTMKAVIQRVINASVAGQSELSSTKSQLKK
jgi:hypothetical protein